ncbi:High mobility group B protein 15 [Apostasia shenzhenica]|uniref:High mobility group B protein 15 n=1 Tax=Apostasia shenzhenica TaxID=1088818 RepID=A0A2I0ABC1_9ASPA|nr:High mobility group B protein 15 [Apostasia shenzhenica]
MSLDGGLSLSLTNTPPLAAVPIQSQSPPPPPSSALAERTANYEDVVSDRNLFMRTLDALHRSLGTKLKVPRVGGNRLDLHCLFVEVTSRGGLQKVIRDRLWKDVISAFNFPSTITNASFVLRKFYMSLLQHYEQVYFFRNKELAIPLSETSPGTNHASPSVSSSVQLGTAAACGTSNKISTDQEALRPIYTKTAKSKSACLSSLGNSTLEKGSSLRGKIKGKFENGYIVTASYGSETLTGILYHAPLQTLPSSSSGQRSRKRSWQAMEDTSLYKPNISNLHSDYCVGVKTSHSAVEKTVSEQLGELWNRLTQPSNEDSQETDSEE